MKEPRCLAEACDRTVPLYCCCSLTYCHLVGFPGVVRTLPHLAFLDISFNPDVVTFPEGEHIRSLEVRPHVGG